MKKTSAHDLFKFRIVFDPQLSPDGKRVLFTHKQIGPKNQYLTNLWITSADKPEPREFTTGLNDIQPRWAPSGTQVAFIRTEDNGRAQLYQIAFDGGEALPLTTLPEGRILNYKWSPDSRWLAVSFREKAAGWTERDRRTRQELGLSDPPQILESLGIAMMAMAISVPKDLLYISLTQLPELLSRFSTGMYWADLTLTFRQILKN